MNSKKPIVDHAKDQAICQMESIREMVLDLNKARESAGNNASHPAQNDLERSEETIHDDALSVEVRSGWHTVGTEEIQSDAEYNILLCTGGPAVRIIGTLDRGQPDSARLEYQDWGTPWTDYRLSVEEEETLLTYASVFYFGE